MFRKLTYLGLFLALLLTNSTTVLAEEVPFKLGFLPSERASELTPKAEKLADFLEERMGVLVEVVVPTSYEPLIEGLRFGHIDAAFMDSGPAWLAHKKTGAEAVLAELKKGKPYYWGEVFVRTDSPIASFEEVIGKKIAFTSWTGSSGFIFPIGTLVKRGLIKPASQDFAGLEMALQQSFATYVVAGGYKQALTLLIEGKVDVAAGAHDAPERFLDPEDRDKIKPVERLGKVPSHPIMVRENLTEEVKAKFVSAMLELNQPDNVTILEAIYGVSGIAPTTTEEHLGDFGPAFESLAGIHEKVFAKRK